MARSQIAIVRKEEKEGKRLGLILTLVLHGIVLLLMLFNLKFYPPDPPIAEQGIAINFGTSDDGKGDVQPEKTTSKSPQPDQEPSRSKPTPVVSSPVKNDVMKSNDPDAVNLKKTEKVEAKKPEKEVEEKKPEIDQRALFTKKKPGGSNTSSEGETGKDGDQGDINGDKNSKSHEGVINGGVSGGGISYDLGGRPHINLPKPTYNSDKEGKVVVTITVDQDGNVMKAVAGARGTTVSDLNLFKRAEEAAKKAKFKQDGNAPERQTGTIVYLFQKR